MDEKIFNQDLEKECQRAVEATLSAIIFPVLEEAARELNKKGLDASASKDSKKACLLIVSKGEEHSLVFESDKKWISIFLSGSTRGRVEPESVDSLFVEEHVSAFVAHF